MYLMFLAAFRYNIVKSYLDNRKFRQIFKYIKDSYFRCF
jgi:hypothetical protein